MKRFRLFIFLFILIPSRGYSQYRFDWAKYNSLSFLEDSVRSFQNIYSVCEKLGSIKNSDAEIELRIYPGRNRGAEHIILYQVKYNAHSIQRYAYIFRNRSLRNDNDRSELVGNIGNNEVCRRLVKAAGYSEDSLFFNIYNQQLTSLTDQQNLIDSFRNQKIELYDRVNNPEMKCSDCSVGFYLVEIKLGEKFRNFRISQQAGYYYYFNPQYPVLKPYADLDESLRKYWEVFHYTAISRYE